MSFVLGADLGSTHLKFVLMDESRAVVWRAVAPNRGDVLPVFTTKVAEASRRGAPVAVAATGYSRNLVAGERRISEIMCHASAFHHFHGTPGTVIDIGGQDTKVIAVEADGTVTDFRLNEKCASGTGKFVQKTLEYLGLRAEDVAAVPLEPTGGLRVSATCAVFAEAEIVSLVAQGHDRTRIFAGCIEGFVERVAALAGRLHQGGPVFLSGGCSLMPFMVSALRRRFPTLETDEQAIYYGAIGAALALAAAK
jgi:predicted CoA-substrate-specific enzyme activase